jgi:hypothetical protein
VEKQQLAAPEGEHAPEGMREEYAWPVWGTMVVRAGPGDRLGTIAVPDTHGAITKGIEAIEDPG